MRWNAPSTWAISTCTPGSCCARRRIRLCTRRWPRPWPPSKGRTESENASASAAGASGDVEGDAGTNGDGSSEQYLELTTTPGRVFFNSALPKGFRFVNDVVGKRNIPIGSIVEEFSATEPKDVVAQSLDRIKALGFRYASQSGLTISIDDVRTPPEKRAILDRHEREAEKAEQQFKRGIITDDERRQKEIEIWTSATSEVGRAMEKTLSAMAFNPLDMMVDSGARGNTQQIRQIAGMKGLVSNPRGEMIPRPIKSSFREGLSVLEYFISTHGARKGLADTALRTADSGYLTRRLVDVAQELIIRIDDCGSTRGIWLENVVPDEAGRRSYLETRAYGRVMVEDAHLSDGSVMAIGTILDDDLVAELRDDPAVTRIRVRSVLTCESEHGVCATCYGQSLATGKVIELGEAVGVIAAQSIGEPGTQLTMRTFHTGGVVGEDITHGLPRVVELFEARTPKGAAVLAHHSGVVRIEDEESGRRITVVAEDGAEESVLVSVRAHLEVKAGQDVVAGDALVEGPKDPKELLEVKGIRETQQYLVEEVQKVYRDQGVSIHDKHIELIVRQMLRRVLVAEPGDAPFLPGERVDSQIYAEVNREPGPRRTTAGRGTPRAHGDHQGVVGHGIVAVGGVVPRDDAGVDRGRHRRASRTTSSGSRRTSSSASSSRPGPGWSATATSWSISPTRPASRCGPTVSTRRPKTWPLGCATWAERAQPSYGAGYEEGGYGGFSSAPHASVGSSRASGRAGVGQR